MRKERIRSDYGMGDIYKYYVKRYGNPIGLTKRQFKELCADLNKEAVNLVISESMELRLPLLGGFRVKKRKQKLKLDESGNLVTCHIPVDWKATKQLWKDDPVAKKKKRLIFIFNEHTDGFRYRFWWDKVTSFVTNQELYYIVPSRANSRLLAKALKNRNNVLNYYE